MKPTLLQNKLFGFLSENSPIFLAIAFAFLIAWALIPVIIKMAWRFQLVDQPNARKEHQSAIPTLGGIAIFIGTLASTLIWNWPHSLEIIVLLNLTALLFVMGIWDDLKDLRASFKFLVQIILAAAVCYTGIRIESLGGIFGIHELPLIAQYAFTILLLVGVTNAFNLMDGIDGLAGSIASTNAFIYAGLFAFAGEHEFAILSACLGGATLGFLKHNVHPASIFMGDTGSLVIGFLLAVFAVKYLQTDAFASKDSLIAVAGTLMLPVFDTLRVFFLRMLKGRSPFSADKNHLHHLLVKTGYNHKKSAYILATANSILMVTAALLVYQDVEAMEALMVLFTLAVFLSEILSIKRSLRIRTRIKALLYKKGQIEHKNYLLERTQ